MSRFTMSDLYDRFSGATPIQRAIRRVCRDTGFSPSYAGSDRAVFDLTFAGREYEMMVEEFRGRVRLVVCSNSRFGLRDIPAPVVNVLEKRNRKHSKCSWEAYHSRDATWPVAVCYCDLEDLDGGTFNAAARLLLEEAHILDSALRDVGLL